MRPGGTVCFHEYSVTGSPFRTAVWSAVAHMIIIPAARLVTGDASLFHYLHRSVLAFDSVDQFEERLHNAGYSSVTTLPMSGWQRGIVHSFVAGRPAT